MPVAQSLRYYRQQFNPEAAYETQAADNGIISMYNPQQEAQYFDAIGKRQERFDATNLALQQERVRIGEMETYDLAELNNRLKSFESNINNLVKDKYNGDYGAAANEIAKQIGTERTNPFYHFNKQKVESGKAYLDAKMKLGANFLSTGNPFDVKFQDWQQGKTFDFTPINRNDIVENSAVVFGTIANTLMNIPEPQLTADQKFMKVTVQNGLKDPEDVRRFLKTESGQLMYKQVLDSMPELQGIDNQDAVVDAITQGAYKAIGKADINYMQNPDYIDQLEQKRLDKVSGKTNDSSFFNMITPTDGIATGKYFRAGENNKVVTNMPSFTINNLDPSRMSTAEINEQKSINDNLSNSIKDFVLTDTPEQFIKFVTPGSKRNTKNMDKTKPITISDIAFSPNTPELVIGFHGVDADGNPQEALIALNAQYKKVQNILPYLYRLGHPDADFNTELKNFTLRNFK